MGDDKPSVVASVVGGSACPQADDTPAPAIALGTTRSTVNELRAPMNRQQAAHTTGKQTGAFTLVELSVTMGVLVLLVLLFTQLFNSAATVTILGYKKMDADSEARQVLDRMTFDFAQMLKRADVDYFLKASGTASDCGACGPQTGGNDQAAFFSTVPGYYPTPTAIPVASPIGASPVSLVSYRINSDSSPSASAFYNRMQRMGKALAWNGVSPGLTPVVYLPQTIGGLQPAGGNWPSAVSSSAFDSNYEVIGPQVFRFEYYYVLTNEKFSDIPWDTDSGHNTVNGMRDVAAIVVDIAVIDPRSKVLVTDCQLAQLNGAPLPAGCSPPPQYPVLIDWGDPSCAGCQWQTTPGLLLAQWRAAIDANTIGLPQPAISGIRVYERYFYLTH